jgi:hypothetical protein
LFDRIYDPHARACAASGAMLMSTIDEPARAPATAHRAKSKASVVDTDLQMVALSVAVTIEMSVAILRVATALAGGDSRKESVAT